jgi:hypothetical protein
LLDTVSDKQFGESTGYGRSNELLPDGALQNYDGMPLDGRKWQSIL